MADLFFFLLISHADRHCQVPFLVVLWVMQNGEALGWGRGKWAQSSWDFRTGLGLESRCLRLDYIHSYNHMD